MRKSAIIFLLAILIMATLACGLPSSPQLPTAIPIDSAATAAAAAQQAGSVAATAAALAGQQGGELLATIQASELTLGGGFEALEQRFAGLQPDANGNVITTVTDSEINQALQGQAEISQDDITIQNLSVQFTGGNVVLNGNMTSPINSGVTASFRPELTAGNLRFTLVSASLGRLPVPVSMVRSVEQTLNDIMGELMSYLPANYTLQSISVDEGRLTVVAHQAQ